VKQELEAYLWRRFPNGQFPSDAHLFTMLYDEEERPIPTREMRRWMTEALERVGVRCPGSIPLSLWLTVDKQALAKQAPLAAVQEVMWHEKIKMTKNIGSPRPPTSSDQIHHEGPWLNRFPDRSIAAHDVKQRLLRGADARRIRGEDMQRGTDLSGLLNGHADPKACLLGFG
jgi:hypothetical protein